MKNDSIFWKKEFFTLEDIEKFQKKMANSHLYFAGLKQ